MEEFIAYILQFGNLNQQQIDLIIRNASEKILPKEDFLWKAGKTVNCMCFVISGVLRVYYYNNKGEEITRYFVDENHLVLNGQNIEPNFIPSEYLQAITDCKIVFFTARDWRDIAETIIGWENILEKIMAKNHREKITRRSGLVSQDAKTRYKEFIEKFPSLANRIQLSHIASYLGITPSSLSRIRKNIL